ncbi:putative glycosyltransferase EpsF [Thalassotalea loyana]|uniref:Glycosyltransferase EpsF n=1 Tax=Thalassotalea loyana TaxID=280483 RepID=A0ABQ6H723_9GAMM|nr:putative glycosyltransferase EpsF [Thalassotalea loyana]
MIETPSDNQTKRVLHVLVTLNLGGAESRVMDLFRNQENSQLQHDFVIMTEDPCYYTNEVLESGGVIHIVRNPRQEFFSHIFDLYRLLIKSPKYDAIHVHTSFHAGICLFIAKCAGIKARVSHARNISTSTPSKFYKGMMCIGRTLISMFSTHRFAISKDAGKYLFGDRDFEVIPNAFHFEKIKHKSEVTQKDRDDLGLLPGINIVAIARFYPVKNHAFMLQVLVELLKVRSDIYVHFIGDGEYREEIELQVASMKLEEHVTFWGRRSDVYQILPCFDLMLMPSITEGLGVAALEAQKAGVACLTSDALPEEADIGAGLYAKLPLSEPASTWAKQCLSMIERDVASKAQLDSLYKQKGYELSYSEEKFYKAYSYDG